MGRPSPRSAKGETIRMRSAAKCLAASLAAILGWELSAEAHEITPEAVARARQVARRDGAPQTESAADRTGAPRCRLTVELTHGDGRPYRAGLIRISVSGESSPLRLNSQIVRDGNWYAVASPVRIDVPRSPLTLEAVHGLETEIARRRVDLTGKSAARVTLPLVRFYDTAAKGLRSGNTHLHLMKLSYTEAERYLRVVPQADNLDLVYLSYLRRIPDERTYISNRIVLESLQETNGTSSADLAGASGHAPGHAAKLPRTRLLDRISRDGALMATGEEHRHNFHRGGEGYGHVMLLDLKRLIRPVSIGPGIMRSGTDGIAIQRGIRRAREDGASVIWCHNAYGLEDLPNWLAGTIDAQNIFDGGSQGRYEDSFYRYLNLGMRVPFSTGTDWFIYDFSRVYVGVEGRLTSQKWLKALRAGRSFITNGPLLEFQVNDARAGDTIALDAPTELAVRGRATGRSNFSGIELIHNGAVVAHASAQAAGQHFVAELRASIRVDQPGWLALRVPEDAGTNILEKPIFGHTSPIYVHYDGQSVFRPDIARELITEIEHATVIIQAKGTFASPSDRQRILDVYRTAIEQLRGRLTQRR